MSWCAGIHGDAPPHSLQTPAIELSDKRSAKVRLSCPCTNSSAPVIRPEGEDGGIVVDFGKVIRDRRA